MTLNSRPQWYTGLSERLVASYTHTTNIYVTVTAIDVGTDTFTCANHGLSNGLLAAFVTNTNFARNYLPNVIPTGAVATTTYYVGLDAVDPDNKFQLYTDVGRTTLLNVTTTGTMTLWHIEALNSTSALVTTITNLRPRKQYLVKFRGKGLISSTSSFMTIWPNNGVYANQWHKSDSTTINDFTMALGNVITHVRAILNTESDYAWTVFTQGISNKSNTTTNNTASLINVMASFIDYASIDITSITVRFGIPPANGTIWEVYELC